MPTNRIASTLAAIAAATLLSACGGSSTSTQSAGVSSLTTTSSVAPSTSASSTSTSASTSASASTSTSTASGSASTSTTTTSQSTSSTQSNPAATHHHPAKQPIAKLAVSSAAFPHGGQIPVRYTCEGGNVSPPLQWGKVPAGTSQMFVLALSLTAGAQGAIRWAVGGIDPSAGGFGSGQLPSGAVVGRSSNGQVGWSGICPTKGKPQAIIMLVYALRHPVQLASGFEPRTVQAQLSADMIGTGVVYGAYKRP